MSNTEKDKIYEESKRDKDSIFSDFFNMFFGRDVKEKEENKSFKLKKELIKGENIETAISIKLEEAFYGIEKKVSLRTVERKNENICNKSSRRNKKW